MDLLAGRNVDVLLAGLGTPRLEGFLRHKVVLVVAQQDGRDLGDQFWVILANEALGTTEESLLMTIGSDQLLEQTSAAFDLLGNLLVEDTLCQNGASLVLGLNAELLSLHVDLNITDVGDAALLSSGINDPASQLLVGRGSIGSLIVTILNDKGTLEVRGEILGTSLHGLLGNVNSPLIILDLGLGLDGLSLTGHFIIAVSLEGEISILAILGVVAVTGTGILAIGSLLLLSLTAGLLFLLLATLGVVANDESAQLEARIDIGALTTSLAVQGNFLVLDKDIGLGVLALLAQHKLGDEAVEVILELGGIVRAVDDPTVVGGLSVGLGTKFKSEVLDEIGRRPTEGLGN